MAEPSASPSSVRSRGTLLLVVVGAVWLTLAGLAAWAGLIVRDPDEPPLRIGLAAGLPVVLVGSALLVRRFRAWVETLDLTVLINLQCWRVAGFAFLALYAQDLLPASFAVPAGYGDIVVGLAAPFVAIHVLRRGRAARPVFLGFTFFGIADFVVAIGMGIVNGIGAREALPDGTLTTPPMAELPLSLIPTFAVPFLLVLHLLSLVRFRAHLAGR
ncbi:hypothetical protein AB0J90_06430 [Micromonospora sp. NPDC049523]|uniref:hypothetical protein n=1 Tax=Micromonospora sp. NPDC049523 TaxID=3155921 RepID=UPI00341D4BEA